MNKIEEMKALVEKRIISMMICVISWKKWKKKQELF